MHPDALFAIMEHAHTRYYFVEFQNAPGGHVVNSVSDEARKFGCYARYCDSHQCERDWEWFKNVPRSLRVRERREVPECGEEYLGALSSGVLLDRVLRRHQREEGGDCKSAGGYLAAHPRR